MDRDWRRAIALVFAVSVSVKAVTALLITQPGYMDAYYYYHLAANLASGRGLVEDLIWNYLDNPAGIPHAGALYWMPLTSLLLAPALWLLGSFFRAAQAALVLLSSCLPVVAYMTAVWLLWPFSGGSAPARAGADPHASAQSAAPVPRPQPGIVTWQPLAVAALTIFSGVYFVYWVVPDSFASFGVTGALALLAMSRGIEGSRRWLLAGALFSALAYLARPDGLMLMGLLLLTLAAAALRLHRRGSHGGWRWAAVTCFWVSLIYAAVLLPWAYRNWVSVGSPWPSGGLESVFQREYNDLFRYGRTLDLSYYLSWGWPAIVASKLRAAWENLLVFAEPFLFYLLPFEVIGAWHLRRRPAAWPFLVYAVLLYLVMTLVFTFAGPRGSLLHSTAALLPFYFVASVKGLELAVAWTASRLRHWKEATAQRNFLALAVIIAVIMSGVLCARRAVSWDGHYDLYRRVAAWFTANTVAPTLSMVIDPPGWRYATGWPAIAFANEDVDTTVDICRRYGASYLVLEADYPDPLRAFYLGQQSHPALVLAATLDGARVYQVMPP